MQIRMTLVDPAGTGRARNVVLRVPATTGLADVEPLLREALGRPVDGQRLTVDGRAVDDRLLLGMPPLVDGAVLTPGRAGTSVARRDE